ncbi:MAG TPA: hypothetical protein VNK96_00635 [Fimbriimonadales bacterium]|nr:hypothetical protein [Fimbriimonadales bacterium]
MKLHFFLITLVLAFIACSPSVQVTAYNEGLKEAKSKNTLLLVDFYSDT